MKNKLYKILDIAIEKEASDVHLTYNLQPSLRIDGKLSQIEGFERCNSEFLRESVEELIKEEELISRFDKRKSHDMSLSYGGERFRVHIFKQKGNEAIVIRIIPREIPSFESLNLPSAVKKCIEYKDGIVIVTGATGSGKSTTLASMIDDINTNQSRHIITVEDPVEYIHDHKRSIVNQREVGSDVDSFSDATVSAMREDPDILLLGEMRDLDTIRNAVTMAETGHLVFATLHARSVAETPGRIIDIFPANQQEQIRVQLANSLKAVISQELLPKVGGGRVPLCEVMFVNDGIRNIIRKNGTTSEINDTMNANFKTLGSIGKEHSITELVKKGFVTPDVAFEGLTDSEINNIRRKIGR